MLGSAFQVISTWVFEEVEKNIQTQIAFGVGQLPAAVAGIGAGLAGQPAGQAAGHGAEEAFNVGPVVGFPSRCHSCSFNPDLKQA